MNENPLRGWRVDRDAITCVGHDLQRPECILAEPDGTLWTADARGGLVRIGPNGTQELVAQEVDGRFAESTSAERYTLGGTLPNGLAFAANGDILIANFGTDAIERMTRDGRSTTIATEIDGAPLGKTNFVLVDSRDRIWFTVTTRLEPWTRSVNEKTADGYVGLVDENGVRVVADGFVGTNEIRFDEAEEWLYVVESNARRISRLRVAADGSRVEREVYGPGGSRRHPRRIRVRRRRQPVDHARQRRPADRADAGGRRPDAARRRRPPAGSPTWDRHFQAGTMTPEILSSAAGSLAPMMASVTFGGPDLRTVYLGSLMGTTIPYFRSPVPGLPLPHWKAAVGRR